MGVVAQLIDIYERPQLVIRRNTGRQAHTGGIHAVRSAVSTSTIQYSTYRTLRDSVLILAASGMFAYLGSLPGNMGELRSTSLGGISVL